MRGNGGKAEAIIPGDIWKKNPPNGMRGGERRKLMDEVDARGSDYMKHDEEMDNMAPPQSPKKTKNLKVERKESPPVRRRSRTRQIPTQTLTK